MTIEKLTTILIVDAIEPCLPTWESLGYRMVTRVPDEGTLGFVILASAKGELMLQTRASLADDLPAVAKSAPSFVLYAQVKSLPEAKRVAKGARFLVEERKTFYGALEAWGALPNGTILGLAEFAG
jgi:hypothetical protein